MARGQAPPPSRMKGGTTLDPGERTQGSHSPDGQQVQPHHDTMEGQTEPQHAARILLTGSSPCPLSTHTWHLSITTPHLDGQGLWSHTHQDLGLEGTLLTDILYRNVAFLNLVDPISHDLLVNLARDLQCPKTDYELWKSSDKTCRQLIYHLTPHSKRQQGSNLPRRKTQSCLKSSLQKTLLAGETVNLSGIPLSARDVQHITRYLGSQGAGLAVLDLSFTELSDELLGLLLPSLWALPRLTQLLLNGNRLTQAAARELTEAVKDTSKFPALAWVDLGNNVDVASLPQPLLVGLRRRLSQRTSLPTIYEGMDLEPEDLEPEDSAATVASTWGSAAAGPGPEPQACCTR
nr:PREDICTED: leucine-rich repeat-containing protein 75B [Equus przewalskii]